MNTYLKHNKVSAIKRDMPVGKEKANHPMPTSIIYYIAKLLTHTGDLYTGLTQVLPKNDKCSLCKFLHSPLAIKLFVLHDYHY